jgi:uridine kinase
MKQAIMNLKSGKNISYHPYQRETGTFALQVKNVQPAEIIIFETSIFSELFDVVVLIEVDDQVLLQRKLSRDHDLRDQEKIHTYHEIAQLPFWKRHKPINPDFIIDNNVLNVPKLIRAK